jgi:serine protease Do
MAPAVVLVRTQTHTSTGDDQHSGSGFIFTEGGLVLTANHVVADTFELTVILHDGREVGASIVGTDAAMDIAVLKLDGGRDWPWLELRTEQPPRVGDRVLALGNPLGLGATVTAGIVSGTNRDLDLDRYWKSDDFIQHDAAINQGNSGGPLVDLDGRVVGMNTSIIAGANTVGFSVPADLLARVIPELREHGQVLRGFLGLDSNRLNDRAAKTYDVPGGALVTRILPDSPAARAGIRVRDVIVAIDDSKVTSGADVLGQIGNRRPGDTVRLTVVRNGKRRTVEVELTRRPKD